MSPALRASLLISPSLLSSTIQAYVRMRKFVQNGNTTAISATVRQRRDNRVMAYAAGYPIAKAISVAISASRTDVKTTLR